MTKPPEGYEEYARVRYPDVLKKQAIILIVVIVFGLFIVLQLFHGTRFLRDHLVTLLLTFLVVGGLTTIGHELTHAIVYVMFGYEIEWGRVERLDAFFVGALDEYVSRRKSLVILSAPVVLELFFFPLLFVPKPLSVFTAFTVLVVNTSMARADLYAIPRVLKSPPGSLVYNSTPEEFCIYRPESMTVESSPRATN